MRAFLDRIYAAAMAGACLGMVVIAVLVFIQILGRVIDRGLSMMGLGGLGIAIPSLAEIGGYLLVAVIALALPGTLRAAGHVRVTFVLRFLGPAGNRLLASAVLALGAVIAGYAAYHSGEHALDAWLRGSVSYGLIPIPTWIPRAVFALGLSIFTIALIDECITALRGRDPAFRAEERRRESEGVG